MDLLTPIGKGQRGLIVAPPRTGKTILLQHIAQAVTPEPSGDAPHHAARRRAARGSDRDAPHRQGRGRRQQLATATPAATSALAELVIERAKRLAEQGKQVFVLLDSLTRLARAYNKTAGNSGRTMSGGVDIRALEVPKRLFGSARVFEEGGSLTVMGTALIETGVADGRRDLPGVQGHRQHGAGARPQAGRPPHLPGHRHRRESGTRKEERLLKPDVLRAVTLLRRHLIDMQPVQAMESLLKQMGKSPTNQAFLDRMVVK